MLLTRRRRSGAVTAEAGIVLTVFMVFVVGLIDLGMGVAQQASLSHAAREGARQAAVHGSMAPSGWNGGRWGGAAIGAAPAGTTPSISQTANTDGWPANAVRPVLTNCSLPDTTVKVEWLDRSDAVEKRVRVTVTSPFRPITTMVFGNPSITLSATSTVLISH